jgi:hypothetical protein
MMIVTLFNRFVELRRGKILATVDGNIKALNPSTPARP